MKIIKRNGAEENFDENKIRVAITKANESVAEDDRMTDLQIRRITESVVISCEALNRAPSVDATSVGLAYVFAIWCKLGLVGMWIAYAFDELIRGTIYAIRWAKGRWKKSFMHELEELEKVEQTA